MKRSKKIIYCDLMAVSGLHTEYNSACIRVLLSAFPNYKRIDFYGEKEHCNIIATKTLNLNILFHPYSLLPKGLRGGFRSILRDLFTCLYVVKVFTNSRKEDLIYFALAFPFAQYCIHLLQLIFRRKVFICQHGEMEAFINGCKMSQNAKKYYSIIRPLLKSNRIIHVILGEVIWKNLRFLFLPNPNVIIIDHPYNFKVLREQHSPEIYHPLIIGQIGYGGISKGTQYLFALASLLRNEINNGQLHIKLVGRLSPEMIKLDEGLVSYAKEMLSDEEFKEGINTLHYTLQLRDMATGKVTASGSFFDTLKYEKPFIGLNNEYINYYVKSYPKAGKCYDSLEEIAKEIRRLLTLKDEEIKQEYQAAISDIQHLKQHLSLENIAKSFQRQYKEIEKRNNKR